MLPSKEHHRKLVLGFQPLIDEDGTRKGPPTTQEEPWVLPADNPWKNPNDTLVYQADGEFAGLDVPPTRVAVEVKECWTPESTRQLQNMLFTKDVQKLCSPSPPVFVNPPPPPSGRRISQGTNSVQSARPNGRKISSQVEKAANNFSRRMLASALLSRTPLAKPQQQRSFDTESIISESSVESEGSSLEGTHHVNETRQQSAAAPPNPPTNSAASSAWKRSPHEEPNESPKKRTTLCGIRPKTFGVFLIGFGCGALSVIVLVVTLAATVSDDVGLMATTDSPKAAGLIGQQKSITRYNATKGGRSLKDDLPLPSGTSNSLPVPPSLDLKGSAPQTNKNKTSGESSSILRGNLTLEQTSDLNVTTSPANPLLPVTSPPPQVPTPPVESQQNESSSDDNKNKTSSTETERQGGNVTSELVTSSPPEESETTPPTTSVPTSVTTAASEEEEKGDRGNATARVPPETTTTVPQQSTTAPTDLKTTENTSGSDSGDVLESENKEMTTDSSREDSLGNEEEGGNRAVPRKTTEDNTFTTPSGKDVLATTAGFTPPSVGNLHLQPTDDGGGPPQPTTTTLATPTTADSVLIEDHSADGKTAASAIPATKVTALPTEGPSGTTGVSADATEVAAAAEVPVTSTPTSENLVETSTSKVEDISTSASEEHVEESQSFTGEATKTTFVPPERISTAFKPEEEPARLQLPLEVSIAGGTASPSSSPSLSPEDNTHSNEREARQVEVDGEEVTTSPALEVAVVTFTAQNGDKETSTESSITGEPLVTLTSSAAESPAFKDFSEPGNLSDPVSNDLDLQTTEQSGREESSQPSKSSEAGGRANEPFETEVPAPPSKITEAPTPPSPTPSGSPERLQRSTSNPRPPPPMTSSDEPSKSKKRKLGWFEKAWRLVVATVEHAKKVVKNPLQR